MAHIRTLGFTPFPIITNKAPFTAAVPDAEMSARYMAGKPSIVRSSVSPGILNSPIN